MLLDPVHDHLCFFDGGPSLRVRWAIWTIVAGFSQVLEPIKLVGISRRKIPAHQILPVQIVRTLMCASSLIFPIQQGKRRLVRPVVSTAQRISVESAFQEIAGGPKTKSRILECWRFPCGHDAGGLRRLAFLPSTAGDKAGCFLVRLARDGVSCSEDLVVKLSIERIGDPVQIADLLKRLDVFLENGYDVDARFEVLRFIGIIKDAKNPPQALSVMFPQTRGEKVRDLVFTGFGWSDCRWHSTCR